MILPYIYVPGSRFYLREIATGVIHKARIQQDSRGFHYVIRYCEPWRHSRSDSGADHVDDVNDVATCLGCVAVLT